MIKNILNQIWQGFCFPYTDDSVTAYVEITPVVKAKISEEEQAKTDQSKKILDIVLKDLEKFPPHEWELWMSMSFLSWYSHECLNYKLMLLKDSDVDGVKVKCNGQIKLQDDNMDILEIHRNQLYDAFFPKYLNGQTKKEMDKRDNIIADFLDDNKRILCKNTTNND